MPYTCSVEFSLSPEVPRPWRGQILRPLLLSVLWLTCTLSAQGSELVSYWPLNGTLSDSAPGGTSRDAGTFVGRPAFAEGYLGKGIVLDGTNYVAIPSSPDLVARNASITVSAWFRVDSWSGRWETLLAKGRGNNYSISHQSLDPHRLAWFGGVQSDMGEVGGGAVNDGRWHHVAGVTITGTQALLFIDGKRTKAKGPGSARLGDSGRPLFLGDNPDSTRENRKWIGAIDDVGIFSTALTAPEVNAIYQLARDEAFQYDLGTAGRLIDLHRRRSPTLLRIGDRLWKYAPSQPDKDRSFVPLSTSGSGITTSLQPTVATFETSQPFLTAGETATLRYRVSDDAEQIRIVPEPGDLTKKSGSLQVSPATTTTYQLTVENEHGQSQATMTVHVDYSFATPRINEFMASGTGAFLDQDQEPADWIELHNPGPGSATTADLFLTDDPTRPRRWPLPSLLLEEGEFLVVFATGKNRRQPGSELHTNFKLDAQGEFLALMRSGGEHIEVVSSFGPGYPKQKKGNSFGFGERGGTGELSRPTPGAVNSSVVTGSVKRVRFGTTRALCNAPFQLVLDCKTDQAEIYFTTDGSIPTSRHGTRYQEPLTIAATTVVRARAFKPGKRPSRTATHTYIFPQDVPGQTAAPAGFPSHWDSLPADYGMDPTVSQDPTYRDDLLRGLRAIPTMALSLPTADLFGTGGLYANPLDSGRAWERATSLELIHPDGREGFQVNCGLRMQGGFSRNRTFPKHGMRVLFKGIYGPTKLTYPLFPEKGAATIFDSLILRAGFNNSWQAGSSSSQHLRDEFIRRSQMAMGHVSSHGLFVHLFLNGLYWGVYNAVERPNGTFAAAYLGGERKNYDALNSGRPVDGTADSWRQMQELARNSTADNVVETLNTMVNLDNLIDYMLLNFYGGNDDWDHHNWYAARKRETGGQYHFFSWDAEKTLMDVEGFDKTGVNYGNNPSYVFNRLLENESFRQRFLARVQLHFFNNGALTPKSAAARYRQLADGIEDAIVAESARWGDAQPGRRLTRDEHWIRERDRLLRDWFPRRTDVVLAQLNARGNLGVILPPAIRREGDSIIIPATAGTLYWTIDGSDPRQPDGRPNPRARSIQGRSVQNTLLTAGSAWKYLDNGSDQGTAWRNSDFDDAQWKSGKARLGYGDDGEVTRIEYGTDPDQKYITAYFRRSFQVPATEKFTAVQLLLCRDDGAAVYINGVEVLRNNLPADQTINFRTLATNVKDETRFVPFEVARQRFKPGSNWIAVEVHQSSASSSDTGFDLELRGIRENQTAIPVASFKSLKARTYLNKTWSTLVTHTPKTD